VKAVFTSVVELLAGRNFTEVIELDSYESVLCNALGSLMGDGRAAAR
jgi:hypothetical protein